MNKREIYEEEFGYKVPYYTLSKDGIIRTKDSPNCEYLDCFDEVVFATNFISYIKQQQGIVIDELLEVILNRLQYLSTLVPSRYTSIAITEVQRTIWSINEFNATQNIVFERSMEKVRDNFFILNNFRFSSEGFQKIQTSFTYISFMQSKRDSDGNLESVDDGVIIEGVIELAIRELKKRNKSYENEFISMAIKSLYYAIWALEERDKDRASRNVTGTTKP